MTAPAALGLVVHTGWAHAVALALGEADLVILCKDRLALWEPPDAEAAQAYHRAAELGLEAARRSIASDERTARRVAARSLGRLADALDQRGHRLRAVRVVDRPRRPLPPLASILGAHPLLHAAEGALFRGVALAEAARLASDAAEVHEAELPERAARASGLTPAEVAARLASAGKVAGPPWSREHKACALAAWIALAEQRGRRA